MTRRADGGKRPLGEHERTHDQPLFSDSRRTDLLAAAEALHHWAHARRATWSSEPLDVAVKARSAANPFPTAAAGTPLAPPIPVPVRPPGPSKGAVATAALGRLASQLAVLLWNATRAGVRGLGSLATLGTPLLRHAPRLAAIVMVLALAAAAVWTWRSYWPSVSAAWTNLMARASAPEPESAAPPVEAAPAKPGPKPVPAPAAAGPSGSLVVNSEPPGARVTIAGAERGTTPLTIDGLRAGSYDLLVSNGEGSVRQQVRVAGGQTTEISVPIYSGFVHVSTPIELQITEGARRVVLDERNQALLPPGVRELLLENRALGYRRLQRVEIKPGETTRLVVEPPASSLTVTATAAAEVLIDGEPAGAAPLTNHPLALGTHEVIVRSEAGVERRFPITATLEPVRLDVDFSAP